MTTSEPAATAPARVDFQGGGAFYAELRERVHHLLADPARARRAQRAIYAKSIVMVVWAIGSWIALVLVAQTWWQAGAAAVSLGLGLAGVGFNITHDANHGSYSPHRRLNRALSWTMDLIGASSYVWRIKHNVVHHTYTNIAGADADIDSMPFARFAPEQPRRILHRFQHFYVWGLYGLFAIKWHTTGDIGYLWAGSIGKTPLRRPRGRDLLGFCAGKALFAAWTVVVPLLLHPAWQVAVAFGAVSFVMAVTLAVTFQLAHCLEEADFPSAGRLAAGGRTEWARHQVETTVDFAPRNRVLTWYLGGLNFQIEHHLFSRVVHTQYPALAAVVQEVCERHGVRYQNHSTVGGALASHARWLRRMGREPSLATP
ncbi:MAG: linoleoyl-CoA desaturase [Miltoncostaeaceae bacterium]|jgi:linoleoyl-CoA desaturase|nr:linoleoyl-CoA desaturase [Miltoncostaeaceae bacterium]